MSAEIVNGDALQVLGGMDAESVHCVVTSPPYWGLRDYGVPGQIGLERTPAEYVARLVAVFAEVWRVLRSDGTCWVNLGDSYVGGGGFCPGAPSTKVSISGKYGMSGAAMKSPPHVPSLKRKDLVGIPWRVAFALQADGWWLRQDIIWAKPNPIPESVKDRCTRSHEYVFLLTKSGRYWYDAGAIAEPVSMTAHRRGRQDGTAPSMAYKMQQPGEGNRNNTSFNTAMRDLPGDRYSTSGKWSKEDAQSSGRRIVENVKAARAAGGEHDAPWGPTRNCRDVWTITTQPFPDAHFATFPVALAERCILAGCPRGGVVLDPFFGAGTTGIAALKHGRECIGIELNEAYCDLARTRIAVGIQECLA